VCLCNLVMPKSKKNKNGKGMLREREELSQQALIYTGPIRSLADKESLDTHTQLINYEATIATSGAGIVASYFVNNISAATNWAQVSALYKEYRILGIRMEYEPLARYSSANIKAPGLIAIDRTSTGTPASYDAVMQYSSARKVSLEDPWSIEAKMSGTVEAQWLGTGTTTPFMGFILYSANNSNTFTIGQYFFYWLVQFRGVA